MDPTALIVVDVQNDFTDIPGAALPVAGGAAVARRIAALITAEGENYAAVVATRDWHVDPGEHFSDSPDYIDTWPPHCIAGSPGARLHPDLGAVRFAEVFSKGAHSASYTGFDGLASDGTGPALGDWLAARGITAVDIVGLATDHCVRATALDAAARGLGVRVRTEFCAGVDPAASARALAEMAAAGVAVSDPGG